MTPVELGFAVAGALVILVMLGVPVAFVIAGVAITVLVLRDGLEVLQPAGDSVLASLEDFTLVAVPLFILMGVAASLSPAGGDMRELLKRWLHKIPGGLIVANILASTVFSALSSTGAATCLAIGRKGMPELQERRYPDSVAAGALAGAGTLGILVPPSLTLIVYGIAGDFSIGRLFLAGLGPGVLLSVLFVGWALLAARRWRGRFGAFARGYTAAEQFELLPRVLPFVLLVAGILYAFWTGIPEAPEVAAGAAVLCAFLVAAIYGMWRQEYLVAVLREAMRESVAVLFIIAAAAVFAFMLYRFGVPEALAIAIADQRMPPLTLVAAVSVFLVAAGLFLPPIAIILMFLPIIIPILLAEGIDPYWFGIIMTLSFQIALLMPPAGANLQTVRHLAPDLSTLTVLRGAIPYIVMIVAVIAALCVFPVIATWLPNWLMGPAP